MQVSDDHVRPVALDFLAGGGEMGELMRSHDWASTPLGAPVTWPRALRTAIRLILNTGHPMYVWWGPDLLCFYNDAYCRTLGPERHPGSLGLPGREVWAEIWPLIGEQVDHVMAGKGSTWNENRPLPITRFGRLKEVFWTYSFSPIDDVDTPGGVGGVLVVCAETTQTVLAERRKGFRLAVEERLRDVADPVEAVAVTSEELGRHLGVGQIGYAEVEAGGRTVLIEREWNDGSMISNSGRHRLVDYGPEFIADLTRGDTVAVADVRTDGRTSSAHALEAFSRASIRAFLDVPLIKGGKLVAVLAVHSATPRAWSPEDVALAEGVAEQTWAAAERARSEASRHDAEERYLALFNAIDQGFCTLEVAFDERGVASDYRFLEVSPGFERQTGIADAAGRWMRDIAPDQDQSWFDTYGKVVRTGEPVRFENYSTPLDRWWAVYAFRISGPNRIAVLFRDISDKKRAESALRESEARLRSLNDTLETEVHERTASLRLHQNIVQSDRSPICAFDHDFRLIAFNQAHNDEFRRVNGFDTKLGDVFPDLFIAEQRPVMRALMARALSGERFTVVEEFGKPELGKPHWEISYTPLRDEDGSVMGAFHHARDITDRLLAEAELARAQEQLRQAQKMEAMGQLTGGVAHDFNNLLTPIVGSLDLLQRKGVGTERERRLIDGAAQSAERAKTLVQRLLAFARRQPLQTQVVDIVALVEGMAHLVASTSGPRVRVEIELADDLPTAKADANQVEMAILNLSVNARDAMPEGGTLTISAGPVTLEEDDQPGLPPGRYVNVAVGDTGTGMDEDTLARAVEPFFSTKGVGRGTGLGLSMAHGLAAQLGGGLSIWSEPGTGTRVDLYLPASDEPARLPERRADAELQPAAGTVLLVDDEELVRMSTADMLADLGYAVLEAATAEEALRLADGGEHFDVLVTDHLMPGLTGTQLAHELRERRPAVSVLVVSGYAELDGIAPELPRLVKPFRQADLAAKLRDLVS